MGLRLAGALGLFIAVVAFAAAVAAQRGIDFGYLSRDPNYLARAPFYAGALSNLGVLLWWTAGALPIFAAIVIHAADGPGRRPVVCDCRPAVRSPRAR